MFLTRGSKLPYSRIPAAGSQGHTFGTFRCRGQVSNRRAVDPAGRRADPCRGQKGRRTEEEVPGQKKSRLLLSSSLSDWLFTEVAPARIGPAAGLQTKPSVPVYLGRRNAARVPRRNSRVLPRPTPKGRVFQKSTESALRERTGKEPCTIGLAPYMLPQALKNSRRRPAAQSHGGKGLEFDATAGRESRRRPSSLGKRNCSLQSPPCATAAQTLRGGNSSVLRKSEGSRAKQNWPAAVRRSCPGSPRCMMQTTRSLAA